MRRTAADGWQYGTGGPVVMGCTAGAGGRHAARMWHDGGPVAHGHHHHAAARGARGWREHQRVATDAGYAARWRRGGRLHLAARGRRGRRLGVQEVAPGLRGRRHVTVLLVLVLRYAPGQDVRQQVQLRTKHTRNRISPMRSARAQNNTRTGTYWSYRESISISEK